MQRALPPTKTPTRIRPMRLVVLSALVVGAPTIACTSLIPEGVIIEETDVGQGDGDGDSGFIPDDGAPIEPNAESCQDSPVRRMSVIKPDGENHPDAVEALSSLTVEQKIELLYGGDPCPFGDCDFNSNGITSEDVQIEPFRLRDGPRGVVDKDGSKGTTFAVNMARGASFDTNLEYRIGQVQGVEMRELRFDMMLAPQVNTVRHPRWARAQESYSEDPFMLGKFGAAYVRGVQENVPACAKHFAANNMDENRETMSANMDEQTLRENYTRAFQIVVEESDPACIMASYNRVNGVHSTENVHLLTDILRNDWNWEGLVISDWWATTPDNGAATLNAGLDLEMPDQAAFNTLPTALSSGDVTNDRIDEAAMRILNVRGRFGQLGDNVNRSSPNQGVVETPHHKALARESAEKGAVLLENDGILPISADVTSILVMGPDAKVPVATTSQTGVPHGLGDRGSSNTNPPYAVSYAAGLTTRAGAGVVSTSNDPAAAAGADIVIIPVTMKHEDEGEAFGGGGDRDDLTFGGGHPTHWKTKPSDFIQEVAAVNPNVVVLIATGAAVIIEDWKDSARAIVQTFYPGQEGGNAVASLLFGDINFYGRLPFTVGTSESQYPYFGNADDVVNIDYLHGYRKFETEELTPRYWMGYGLSYTEFTYSDLVILCDEIGSEGAVNAKITVTNTGNVAGDEAVLAFLGYPNTEARRPVKELKGFQRTGLLAPGESKDVYFSIPMRDARYWGDSGWELEDVVHQLIIAPSADPADPNLLQAEFSIQ